MTPWIVLSSLDNLPKVNQRCEVQSDNIHQQLRAIVVLNHGFYHGILDLSVVQVDADFVADLELPLVWLLRGWHAEECTLVWWHLARKRVANGVGRVYQNSAINELYWPTA